jgi:ABC-type amino acid transport substrate-binding protein
MLRKKIFFTLMVTVLLFLGCAQEDSPAPKPKGELVVGMSLNYPPIAYAGNDSKPSGLEADFAHALAKELNLNVRIKVLPWEQLPMALETGIVDVAMAGISITKKRSQYALFSEPYMSISQMAVMREGDSAPNTLTQGAGEKIGYIYSTTGEIFVKETFPKASIKGFTSDRQGIAAVMNGEIDYFFHDAPSIWYYTAELSLKGIMGWYVPYTKEHLAWAFSKKNPTLRDNANKILESWRKNGQLNRMIQKWIRVQVVTPNGQKPISFE